MFWPPDSTLETVSSPMGVCQERLKFRGWAGCFFCALWNCSWIFREDGCLEACQTIEYWTHSIDSSLILSDSTCLVIRRIFWLWSYCGCFSWSGISISFFWRSWVVSNSGHSRSLSSFAPHPLWEFYWSSQDSTSWRYGWEKGSRETHLPTYETVYSQYFSCYDGTACSLWEFWASSTAVFARNLEEDCQLSP